MFWCNKAVCRIGVAAAAAVLLAACSSGSGGGGAAESSAQLKGAPIALGMILNTVYLPYAPEGAQAAVAAINAAGGVKGHPLELDTCDDQLNANAAAACASGFVNNPSVIATAGNESSYGAETNPVLASAKIAGIGTNLLGTGDYAAPNVFAFSSGGLEFLAGARFLFKDLRASQMGMVIESTPTGAALPALVNK